MEKIIKIGDYEIPVKSHAGILLSYKSNFHRDALKDIISMRNINLETLDGLDLDVFYRLVWVFAKAANKDLPPLEIWLENLDVQPFDFVYDSVNVIMDMLYSSIQTTVKKK